MSKDRYSEEDSHKKISRSIKRVHFSKHIEIILQMEYSGIQEKKKLEKEEGNKIQSKVRGQFQREVDMEQAKEPTQHIEEKDQNGSKDCSSESEDDARDHSKVTRNFNNNDESNSDQRREKLEVLKLEKVQIALQSVCLSLERTRNKDDKHMTKIPEKGDRGKVLGVADDEVNTLRSTEDLVSGKDIRADNDRKRRRTESTRGSGAPTECLYFQIRQRLPVEY